jgi:hypothetical protein
MRVAASLLGRQPYTTATMAKYWECLQPEHIAWIVAQKLFWVATSPLSPDGHVNVSPKGVAGTFHVLNERTVWYEDLTGSGTYIHSTPYIKTSRQFSGVETISHLRENGRITIMFSAFDGAPRIVRLFGKGKPPRKQDRVCADVALQEPFTSLDRRSTLNSSLPRRGRLDLVR